MKQHTSRLPKASTLTAASETGAETRFLERGGVARTIPLPIHQFMRRVPPNLMRGLAETKKPRDRKATDELLHLYGRLVDLTKRPSPVVQFAGVEGGEGTSTVAAMFASVIADLELGAVLLFSDRQFESERSPEEGTLSELSDVADVDQAEVLPAVVDTGLFVCPASIITSQSSTLAADPTVTKVMLFDMLRPLFRLVVIDSGPVLESVDSLRVCRNIDGVVLVIEADRTSTSKAVSAIKRIAGAGGNLLGVLFNREKPLVPKLFRPQD